MDHDQVKIEFLPAGVVRITPSGSMEDISLLPAVLSLFEKELRKQHTCFIFDAHHLPLLPPSWIVLIYEMTARARRRGGNLCIVNLQERAVNDLYNFRADDYLCFEESELTLGMQDALPPLEPRALQARLAGTPRKSSKEKENTGHVEIPSRVDMLYRACDFVLETAQRMGFPESELSKIKISVYEGCLNAIEHAYHSDSTRQVKVEVTQSNDRLIIRIIDHGDGFEVKSDEDFDAAAAAAARKTGGMGLHIIRRSMDSVRYVRNRENGNMLIMEKRLVSSEISPPVARNGVR